MIPLTNGATNKAIKTNENFADNHGHNILRLFDTLPNFPFHHKWNKGWLLVINII